MASFVVTTTNWNSLAFWSSIDESGFGHVLDFSNLTSDFAVSFNTVTGEIAISDGSTAFIVGDSTAAGGPYDATMGGTTQLSFFDVIGGAGDDTITGGATVVTDTELLTNGSFEGDLDGWTIINPTNGQEPEYADSIDAVRLNSSDETAGGDGISQQFGTVVGETYSTSFDLTQNGLEPGIHTVLVEILDENGVVIDSVTTTIGNGQSETVTLDFAATTGTSEIRITNPSSEATINTDVVITAVSVTGLAPGAGDDLIFGGGGSDTIDGGIGDDTLYGDGVTSGSESELLNNGSFDGDLNGWTIINDAGRGPIYSSSSDFVRINSADETASGDGISQQFGTIVGETYATSVDLSQNGGAAGDHTALIEVLDENGVVIHSVTTLIGNGDSETVSFDFVATTATSEIRITNPVSEATVNTDLVITNVSVVGIDPADFAGDDTISGGAGDDLIIGGGGADSIDGGADNDTIYGDGNTARDSLNYENLTTSQVRDGVTINAGTVDVTFSSPSETGITLETLNTSSPYTGGVVDDGNGVDANSVLAATAGSASALGEYQWDFSEPVTNVSFNVVDLDNLENLQILAYDVDGNPIDVIFTPGSAVTVSDSNGDGRDDLAEGSGSGSISDASQAVTVTIPGPVASIEAFHTVDGSGTLGIQFTEMFFDSIQPGAVGDNDIIDGGDGDDVIFGEGGDDTITGGTGADTITGGAGADSIDGGADNDIIYGDGNGDTDTVRESLNYQDLSTSQVNNGATINTGNVDVTFDSPTDTGITLITYDTSSPYTGGVVDDGNGVDPDSVMQATADDSASLGEYEWRFSEPVTNVSFNIVDLDDFENIQILAYDINNNPIDVFLAPGSNVSVSDSNGDGINDLAEGSGTGGVGSASQAVTVTVPGPVARIEAVHTLDESGGIGIQFTEMFFDVAVPNTTDGDDIIDGGAGDDVIFGEDGDDTINGGIGDDTLDGGLGSDTFQLGNNFGTDIITGGEDDGDTDLDVIDASAITGSGVTVDVSSESGTVSDGTDVVTFDELEGFVLTDQDDTFTANGSSGVSVAAGGGDDTITEGHGSNTIDAGTGSDTIYAGFGTSMITGGEDDDGSDIDVLDFGVADDAVTISFNDPEGGTYNDDDGDSGTFSEIEQFDLTSGDDTVNADLNTSGITVNAGDGSDTIIGGSGDDVIDGGSTPGDTADSLSGGGGNDIIVGDEGNDTIDGGTGNDTITGGTGDDTLTGGAGDDVFILADGSGADVITDFDTGDDDNDGFFNDQLDVSNLTDSQGNPVNAWDVVVSDQGGEALLTFPNGETLLLSGVAPATVTGAPQLFAAGIPCFTRSTLIGTPQGEVPIEDLRSGDMVLTLDNGAQPLLWVGSRKLDEAALREMPSLKPIYIPEGLFGNHSPLLVSPQHGMLLDSTHGLQSECLARGVHLAKAKGPVRVAHGKRRVDYHHLLFAQHQIIWANGALSESFYPGPNGMKMLGRAERLELCSIIAGLDQKPVEDAYGATARKFLKYREIKSLIGPNGFKQSKRVPSEVASLTDYAAALGLAPAAANTPDCRVGRASLG